MTEGDIEHLRDAVERQHGGRAVFVQSVPVKETSRGQTVWEGMMHVFDLSGHPWATRAYAWAMPMEGGSKPQFFAVLHGGKIDSPQAAVRAAIAVQYRRSR